MGGEYQEEEKDLLRWEERQKVSKILMEDLKKMLVSQIACGLGGEGYIELWLNLKSNFGQKSMYFWFGLT